MKELDLNSSWDLCDIAIDETVDAAALGRSKAGWIATPVPGDIHQGLISAGRIPEPLLGLNSKASSFTETRAWIYRKIFPTPAGFGEAERVELELDGLDLKAEVFFNGQKLATHRNCFRPLLVDLTGKLALGADNILLIRLSVGAEDFSLEDVDYINRHMTALALSTDRGDPRRPFLRKPQYCFGWDWSPRLPTVAIAGGVKLRAMNSAVIRDLQTNPRREGSRIVLEIDASVEWFHYYSSGEGSLEFEIRCPDGSRLKLGRRVFLRSGLNHLRFEQVIEKPELWWPRGMGAQALYQISAILKCGKDKCTRAPSSFGLRFIELDTDGTFAIRINGEKVFCKGGNWIPADALYARVDKERYETLVRRAAEAGFNMLRVWGGGLYEHEAFYRACDREGIMVWQDFMFACSPIPDDLAWFREEVRLEAEYQTKRLRKHPSLVLWCGNNEITWAFRDWWKDQTQGGAHLFNYLLPETVHRFCPEIPYWNGSPYGGAEPNSGKIGDEHKWHYTMSSDMEERIEPRRYDGNTSPFVSEYGYVGPCGKTSTLQYLDGAPFEVKHEVWQHHNNTFEKDTVLAGIAKHYCDPAGLDEDGYLYYAGLCQGLMLGYSLESLRFTGVCNGALFWMYNDCWGEVGWTIVDYYLRTKPS
ncbi:MAG: beta-mannosidase [Planctomycetes bacterium]|nr:beta-mannosidase [Planctomycetota bacterium]